MGRRDGGRGSRGLGDGGVEAVGGVVLVVGLVVEGLVWSRGVVVVGAGDM